MVVLDFIQRLHIFKLYEYKLQSLTVSYTIRVHNIKKHTMFLLSLSCATNYRYLFLQKQETRNVLFLKKKNENSGFFCVLILKRNRRILFITFINVFLKNQLFYNTVSNNSSAVF